MASALKQVPMILEAAGVTPEEMKKILDAQKEPGNEKKYAAEIAFELGIITPERKQTALKNQATARAHAAVMDYAALTEGRLQADELPAAFLGRDGVASPAFKNPNAVDAATSAANLAAALVSLDGKGGSAETLAALKAAAKGVQDINDGKKASLKDFAPLYAAFSKMTGNLPEEKRKMATDYLRNRRADIDNGAFQASQVLKKANSFQR